MNAIHLTDATIMLTSHTLMGSSPAVPSQTGMEFASPAAAGRLDDGTGLGSIGAIPDSGSWALDGRDPAAGSVAFGPNPAKLVVFGDLLSDDGNAASVQQSLGNTPDYVLAPYSPTGDFSNGAKWTTDLAQSLGMAPSQQENFAYEGATGGSLGDAFSPVNPAGGLTPLDTFAGQIQQFEQQGGTFSANDVVSVTFGGNDIFLASADQLAGTASADQVITDSVDAIISGMKELSLDGAKHFLVSNSPDVTLAPIFQSAEFLASGATPAGVEALVNDFNSQLTAGLATFKSQTGLDVKTLDLHTLFNNIASDPSLYGFNNVTQPVISSIPGTTPAPVYNPAINGQSPAVAGGSLFMDPLFDTTSRGQMLIAQTAHNTLA